MATKTADDQASLATKPYFGDAPEAKEQESRLLTLGDADKTALDTVRALTELMTASDKMQETRVLDALAAMRTDLLMVQQSLSQNPDELNEDVAVARARLDAHAVPSLNAIEEKLTERLEQGNVQEVDAATEQKAIADAFGKVREGFNQLMPQQPATEHPAPQQPSNGIDPNQVGATVKDNFAKMQQELTGGQPQQPAPEKGGFAQAETQRREAAAMAGAQGRGA